MPSGPWTMLLGYALFGFVPGLLKLGLEQGMDPSLAVVVRFVIAVLLIGAVSALARNLHVKNPELRLLAMDRRGLLARGVFGGVAVASYFWAVQLTGAGLGTLLNYTHSIWSNVFSVALGQQKPRPWFWSLLAMAGVGVILVIDPSSDKISILGLLVGLFSGMAGGAAVLTIKTLRRSDNSLTINMALALGGIGVAVPLLLFQVTNSVKVTPNSEKAWLFVAISGVFSLIGQILFTHGFKHTSVALASLMSLITPIIAIFCGFLFLNEALTPHFLLGSALILIACSLLGLQESSKKLT